MLFEVRGFSAYRAEERAKTIKQRIEEIAADRSAAIESLRVGEMADRTRIMAGERLLVAFVDADAAAAEGVSRQLLAERVLIKIRAAIASYRNERSPRVLLTNTAYALGATVLLTLALLVVRRIFSKLDAMAERRFRFRIEAFETQSHKIVTCRGNSNKRDEQPSVRRGTASGCQPGA